MQEGFAQWKWQDVRNLFLGVVDIAKHLLDCTFLRKQMRDFGLCVSSGCVFPFI